MAKMTCLSIEGYRSVGKPLEIVFPENHPLVLLGENNAGKSNIVRALDLLLGPMWPSNYDPEDHEFFQRDRTRPIRIEAEFHPSDPLAGQFTRIFWHLNPGDQRPAYRVAPGHRGYPDQFTSNEARDSCVCVVVQAERNLNYHLSYASKYTLLSRLMHRFHKALTQQRETREALEQLFAIVKEQFAEIDAFSNFTKALQSHLGDLVTSMTHQLQVDFEAYNPANFFHALRLQASEGGQARTLDEMGTGEQQVLALSFAYAYATAFHEGIILAIEEPESHLHPLAQEWLGRRIRSMSHEGLQIVLTTHSSSFIDIMGLEGLVLVSKSSEGTEALQLDVPTLVEHCLRMRAPTDRCTNENVLPFYTASATKEILEGFFAKGVVLVEGRTEELALPVYFRHVGFDHAKEGVAIVPVMGKGNLAKWYRLFVAYEIPCFVTFDNDVTHDSRGSRRADVLTTLGISSERQRELLGTSDLLADEAVAVFGVDFETCFRHLFEDYAELETSAAQAGIDSKPLVARWVAERLRREVGIGWATIEALVGAIRRSLHLHSDA